MTDCTHIHQINQQERRRDKTPGRTINVQSLIVSVGDNNKWLTYTSLTLVNHGVKVSE